MIEDEILDLVDDHDTVIGTMPRSEVYAKELHNFRVINAFIMNREGKLWIPRRTAQKHVFPSALDVSVGGHVSSGETYEQSFLREASEEVNIDLQPRQYEELFHLSPKNGTSAYMTVYLIEQDESPDYNPDDFSEAFWMSPEELLTKIEQGEKCKDDLPIIVRNFQTHLTNT